MTGIIDSVVNTLIQTTQRLIRNIKSGAVGKKEEKTGIGNGNVQYDLHHRLEGLLHDPGNDKYGQNQDLKVLPKAKKAAPPTPASPVENVIGEIKKEDAAIESKSTEGMHASLKGHVDTLYKPSIESEVASPVIKTADRKSIKGENVIQTLPKAGTATVEKTTDSASVGGDQTEIETLQKEVEAIETAILEYIEYTVKPESRGPQETIDGLINQWSGKKKTAPGMPKP